MSLFEFTALQSTECKFKMLQRPKCEQYWPDAGTKQTYGQTHVTCLSEDDYAEFIIRVFTVENVCT